MSAPTLPIAILVAALTGAGPAGFVVAAARGFDRSQPGVDPHRGARPTGLYFTDAWLWLELPTGFAVTLSVLGFGFLG